MSYTIVWEFLVPADRVAAFEAAYGPAGDWARLFARAPGFLEVQLLRSHERPGCYLTIDRWQSADAFASFKRQFAEAYLALDEQLEGLADAEVPLGTFDDVTRREDGGR